MAAAPVLVREQARGARWRWVLLPAAIGLGSRAFSVAVMIVEATLRGVQANQFTTWDGTWYIRIAATGYHAAPDVAGKFDFAFFPAWPLLIRTLSFGPVPPGIVAFAVANLLFVIAAILVWRVVADRFGPGPATGAVALLAFAPPAYAFSMAYAESLFMVAVAGSLATRRPWLKGLLAAVASATRLAGLALGAAGILAILDPSRRRLLLAAAIGAGVGFALWFAYVAILTGNPLGFFEGSSSWMRFNVLRTQLNAIDRHPVEYAARFAFVALVLAGSVLAVRRDRELGLYAVSVVGIAILSVTSVPIQSIARYALPAFPAYAVLATRLGGRATALLVAIFALGQVWFAAWTIGPGQVPP